MLYFGVPRLSPLTLASLFVAAMCVSSGCSRDSTGTSSESTPKPSVQEKDAGKGSTAPAPNGSTQSTQQRAEKSMLLVERWTDLDLPTDVGSGQEPPGTVFARLRVADDGVWHFGVAKSRRFESLEAELVLGKLDDVAFGSSSSGSWSRQQDANLRATVDRITGMVRSAVASQRNTQSVVLSISDRPRESSRLHIGKTAPCALIAMVADAIVLVRAGRREKRDDTPLALLFSNTEPGGLMDGDKSPQSAADAPVEPPLASVSLPVSVTGTRLGSAATDTCDIHIFNLFRDAPTPDGWRIRIGSADAKPLAEVADVREALRAVVASSPGSAGDNGGFSGIRLLIRADYRAPGHFLSVLYAACTDARVRISKLSLVTLNAVEDDRK